MGEEARLIDIEVIQDGLIQMDIEIEEKLVRVFIQPSDFFLHFGSAMQKNYIAWIKREIEEQKARKRGIGLYEISVW